MPGFLFYYRRSVCRGEHLTRLPYFPKKRKVADNQHIINHLPRAENGTRTRDLNLGKVALSSPQNAARLGVTNWAISRYALCRVLHSHPKIGL